MRGKETLQTQEPLRIERSERKPMVLVLHKKPQTAAVISDELQRHGFNSTGLSDIFQAENMRYRLRPDIALMDRDSFRSTGRDWVDHGDSISIISMASSSGPIASREAFQALDSGAASFVSNPRDMSEIVERTKGVVRTVARVNEAKSPIVGVGDLVVDLEKKVAWGRGLEEAQFRRQEWLVFSQLALNSRRVMFNEELVAKVYGINFLPQDEQSIRAQLSLIRKKLGTYRKYIQIPNNDSFYFGPLLNEEPKAVRTYGETETPLEVEVLHEVSNKVSSV